MQVDNKVSMIVQWNQKMQSSGYHELWVWGNLPCQSIANQQAMKGQ